MKIDLKKFLTQTTLLAGPLISSPVMMGGCTPADDSEDDTMGMSMSSTSPTGGMETDPPGTGSGESGSETTTSGDDSGSTSSGGTTFGSTTSTGADTEGATSEGGATTTSTGGTTGE